MSECDDGGEEPGRLEIFKNAVVLLWFEPETPDGMFPKSSGLVSQKTSGKRGRGPPLLHIKLGG